MNNRPTILNYMLGSFVLLGIIFIIATFAFWQTTIMQNGENVIKTSCVSMNLTNEKNAIDLQKTYPLGDIDGKQLLPFSFTVENNCDQEVTFKVALEILGGSTLNSNYIKSMLNEENPVLLSGASEVSDKVINDSQKSLLLKTDTLNGNDSKNYDLRLWLDENTPLLEENTNKTLKAKIVIIGELA